MLGSGGEELVGQELHLRHLADERVTVWDTGEVLYVHPVASLFPMMSDEELYDLAEDIKANGQADPIVLDQHGQLIDGRIAFLKAELKITPAQEPQWQQVAAAMRENANVLDRTIATARQDRAEMDAVQRLELREQFAKARADNDARLLAAFKPLYAGLSPEQQQMANRLVAAHHGWHHRA